MNWKYTCLNPIAEVGLGNLTDAYRRTENFAEADAVFVEEVKKGDICAYVYAMNDRPMSSVYSAGWIRSTLKAGDEVEFRNNFEIGLYNEPGNIRIDSMEAVMSIYGTVSEDGEMWYHDVFIDPPDDEEEEDED